MFSHFEINNLVFLFTKNLTNRTSQPNTRTIDMSHGSPRIPLRTIRICLVHLQPFGAKEAVESHVPKTLPPRTKRMENGHK